MTGLATRPIDILRFLHDRAAADEASILVTLTGVEGSSPRALGAQMAVSADGRAIGSFSGGCIEGAVVSEALSALAAGQARQVRLGRGSPYFDIRLPCGGGIDLLFTPLSDPDAIASVLARLGRREPAGLALTRSGVAERQPTVPTGWRGEEFVISYTPNLRVIALGQGEEIIAVAKLAVAFGADTAAYSPYENDIQALAGCDLVARKLHSLSVLPQIGSDRWTAFVFLFHDREWEETLIPWALGMPSMYIGALGSFTSHAARRSALAAAGVSAEDIERLRSPIGLIPSTRDASTLAISVMAEIADAQTRDAVLRFYCAGTETARGAISKDQKLRPPPTCKSSPLT